MTEPPFTPLQPFDEHNQVLEKNLHPPDRKNPTPDGRYNLVVIGAGIAGHVFSVEMENVDRAVLEGDTDGFVRIHVKKGTDKIVAATIVAKNAGDMISPVSQAMTAGIGLGTIANTISPYPRQGEAIRKVGDAYNRTKLTPTVAKVFEKWLEWTR